MLKIKTIGTLKELAERKQAWSELVSHRQETSVFHLWEWAISWGEVYQHQLRRGTELRILVAENEVGTIKGILPLVLHSFRGRRMLTWIGGSPRESSDFYPELGDLLCHPDDRDSLFPLFVQEVRRIQYDSLGCNIVPPDSVLLPLCDTRFSRKLRDRWYLTDLSQGLDLLFHSSSASTRSRFRRMLKKADEIGVRVEKATGKEQSFSFLDELIDLHQRSWKARGEKGAFHRSIKKRFHRALIEKARRGFSPEIFRISGEDGIPLALLYGFQIKNRFEFFQSGIAYDRAELLPPVLRSLGVVSHLLVMKQASSFGIDLYDFLGGENDYKQQLATEEREVFSLFSYRLSVRNIETVLMKGTRKLKRVLGH